MHKATAQAIDLSSITVELSVEGTQQEYETIEAAEVEDDVSIEENTKFLNAMAELLGHKLTVAECYVAYALRDGKYQLMDQVPTPVKDKEAQ